MPIITTSDLHPLMPHGWHCDREDCRYGCHDDDTDDDEVDRG